MSDSETGGSERFEEFVIVVSEDGSPPMEFKLAGEFVAGGKGWDRDGTIAALIAAINNPDCEAMEARE